MKKKHDKVAKILAEEGIDTSDIPELTAEDFKRGRKKLKCLNLSKLVDERLCRGNHHPDCPLYGQDWNLRKL